MAVKKRSRSRIKVSDVAVKAGVSVATVSRAFNLPKLVREDVRRRVLDVARQLGYSPNPAAKALRLQKTHIIGAVIPTLDYAIFARMIDSFQETLASVHYMTIVLTTGFDNRDVFDKMKLLIDRGAEALLIVGAIEDKHFKAYLKDTHIPVVTTYSHLPRGPVPSIGFDNYAATQSMMQHLIGLGHQSFAMIAGIPDGNDRQRARIAAYTDAIVANGLEGANRVFARPHAIGNGVSAMREIHTTYPQATAIVCNTDVFAFGALHACKELGLKVPDDVSITGFDNAEYAALLDPPLTTLAVPAQEMGICAAQALYQALSGGKKLKSQQLATKLVIRHSSAPPLGSATVFARKEG